MPETFSELVNKVLRDHEGYTGDSFGNVGSLPVGDQTTARKPIVKRDLRQVLLAPESYAIRAEQAAAAAVDAASGVPMQFESREALAAALPSLPEGHHVTVQGVSYVVDDAATGMASGLWDIGLDGARAADRPLNAYIAAFHDHNSPRVIRLYSSADGVSWRLLNALPLEYDAGIINGGNPVIAYREGWFYLLVSFASLGNYDFRIYKTRDFTSFVGPFNCKAGATAIASATNPAPGGSVPANEIWGADMTFTPDGVMHVLLSVPYGPEKADVRGRMVGDRRMFRTVCTNLETLTFAAPTLEALPSGHAPRLYQSTTGAVVAPTFPLSHQTIRQAGDGGFEIGFAENFLASFPLDDLIIVPVAKGGTGFNDGEWIVGGPAYAEAITRIRAVRDANPGAVIEGVLWHQGERDRGNNPDYQAQMNALAGRFRSSIPELEGKPFIFGEIGRFVTGDNIGVNTILANAVAATPNTAVASSEGLTDRGDGLHFNSPSYRALGTRYWEAFKTLRGSVGSAPTPTKRIIIIAGQSNAVGHATYETPSMIDASVTRTPSKWLMNVKDSTQQTLRIYSGPTIQGPWEFQEGVAHPSYAIEGSSIVPRRLSGGSVAWDLYAEAHNTLPDWVSAQQIMVYRGNTSASGWGSVAPTWLKSTRGIRHGTPLNLGFEDPEAFARFQRIAAVAAGGAVENNEQWNELLSGSRSIVPNPGAVYYVTGGNVTNLTILDSSAEEFFLAVLSTNTVAGINIVDNGKVLGSVSLGFGSGNNRLVRFIKREDTGRYHAESGAGRAVFAANKGGSEQTITTATTTQITFPNEVLDAGGHFTSNGWTPPAGRYFIQASISFTGAISGQTNTLELRRNGTSIRRVLARTTDGVNCLTLSAITTGNGTDTFTLHAELPGSGDKTISGTPDVTWFEGAPI